MLFPIRNIFLSDLADCFQNFIRVQEWKYGCELEKSICPRNKSNKSPQFNYQNMKPVFSNIIQNWCCSDTALVKADGNKCIGACTCEEFNLLLIKLGA